MEEGSTVSCGEAERSPCYAVRLFGLLSDG